MMALSGFEYQRAWHSTGSQHALCARSRTLRPHIFLLTACDVKAGQEALLDYGPVSAQASNALAAVILHTWHLSGSILTSMSCHQPSLEMTTVLQCCSAASRGRLRWVEQHPPALCAAAVLSLCGMQDFHRNMEEDLKRAAVIVVGVPGPSNGSSTQCLPKMAVLEHHASDNFQ